MSKKFKKRRIRPRGNCYYCQKQVFKTSTGRPGESLKHNEATIDHKLPLVRGGLNDLNNRVIACHQCNNTKGDMAEDEFRFYLNDKSKLSCGIK